MLSAVTKALRWLWRKLPTDMADDYRNGRVEQGLGLVIAEWGRNNLAAAKRDDERLFALGSSAFWLDPARYEVGFREWLLVEPPKKPCAEMQRADALMNLAGHGLQNSAAATQMQMLQQAQQYQWHGGFSNIHKPTNVARVTGVAPSSKRRFDTPKAKLRRQNVLSECCDAPVIYTDEDGADCEEWAGIFVECPRCGRGAKV